MKVLFLDFDGVLNSHASTRELGDWCTLVPSSVLMVQLIHKAGAEIVVSSTWRKDHSIKELSGILGLKVFDKTPDFARFIKYPRGSEINYWLATHRNVDKYAILDDEVSDMLDHQKPFIVKTSMDDGMQVEHYHKIKEILELYEP